MQTAKLRILYIDDNKDACFIVSTLLKQSGYAAAVANNVRDALWLAEREREHFDLYILDQVLVDGMGLHLCQTLRAFNRRAPVIFYAEDASDTARSTATRAGAQGYVVKPHLYELIDTVHRLLAGKEMRVSAA